MFIIDGHCDTLSRCLSTGEDLAGNSLHWDIARAMQAGVRVQFMAAYTDYRDPLLALDHVLRQFNLLLTYADQNQLTVITRADQLCPDQGLGAVMHLEGGWALGYDTEMLHILYRLGLRSLGLTWNHRNQLADGVGEERAGGLSNLGRQVLKAAETLSLIIDVAHLAEPGFYEVLDAYPGPVVYSHGNYGEVYTHRRNLSRKQLRALADHGGIMGLSLVPHFIAQEPTPEAWLEHLCRAAEVVGCAHLALGSDFDGFDWVVGHDVGFYTELPTRLREAGFAQNEIHQLLWANWERILRQGLG